MKIQKLPENVRSKLQSGIVVTDAVQCVKELVHNSLDAEATGIAVRIDLETYQIRVIDNGKGIKKDDLEFVGERYMTTKYCSFDDFKSIFPTYGFRGQALSCLQDVSRSLTIETKTDDEGPTFVKIFRNNNASQITEIESKKSGTGTTIIIEDFMYTMPVRRKRINEVFDLEEIKIQLQYLAIIHFNVCFTLRNENKGLILLQTSQASNILESLSNIFGKTLAKSLKALDHSENKFEISGFISLKPHTQNNVQLLYINRRIISKGIMHKFINNTIKEYRGQNNLFSDPFELQILKTLKMSYNAYIIHIKCPHYYYELFTNIRKTTVEFKNWKDVLRCIHKAIKRVFKKVLKSDCSSNSQKHSEDKNKTVVNKKDRKILGTSFLVNAVKGAPAKRGGPSTKKDSKKRKRIKTKSSKEISDTVYSINYENKNNCKHSDSLYSSNVQRECTNDSLESPIPKKKLNLKLEDNLKLKETSVVSESFVEFYKWLKTNFETDISAFNLYNDFLKFKNNTNHPKESLEMKSPVLGGRLKKKQGSGLKKIRLQKGQNKISNDFPALDEGMTDMTQNQLKIIPNDHLKLKKAIQFNTEVKSSFPETLNLGCIVNENLNFKKHGVQSAFKKPKDLQVLCRNQKETDYNQTVLSLPSSEARFTNIIKFRNLSESFFRQPITYNEIPVKKNFGSSELNSWASHYQTFIPANGELCEKRFSKKNFISQMKTNEENLSEEKKIMSYVNFYDLDKSLNLPDSSNKKKKRNIVRNVQIQVSLSEAIIPIQKLNAIVQTDQIINESPSFENNSTFAQVNSAMIKKNPEVNFQEHQLLENNLSHEVPNPDFWNTSGHVQFEVEVASDMNELIAKNPSNDSINEKHLTSSDFVCGHKSYSTFNLQNEKSVSKETQTIAALWTDSLTKLGSPLKNTEVYPSVISKSNTDKTPLPKTLPLEVIECNTPGNIETRFHLTDRYDIVPKGLSPEFLNSETAPISILSPYEKSKIKLTIDNAKNDLLRIIKWQDESTGDLLKPTIPDGIFFEMRQKAEEISVNYENPVLSASLSYYATKIHNLLHSFAFTKELLTDVEILGQLDKKFIVTKMKILAPKEMELLSLFDQHAVDERIKLEELMKEHISPDGIFISSCLKHPVECVLGDSDVRIVNDLKEKMLNFGLSFKLVNEKTISINAVPTFLLDKHLKDLKNKKETSISELLKSLIANIIEEVTETRGAASKIPKIIHNAFCLEACHRDQMKEKFNFFTEAIKFNKTLSIDNMTEMMNKLQNCKLPFQCAHGRPSVIPIIDLKDFKPTDETNNNIDFQEIKKFFNERKSNDIENRETTLS